MTNHLIATTMSTITCTYDEIHHWWTVSMWVLGATVWTLAALLAINWLLWKLVCELVGWPTIIKALRMYRKQGANHD